MIPGTSLVVCHRHPSLHHPQGLPKHQAQCQPPASMHQNHRHSLPEKTSVHLIQRSSSPAHLPQSMVLWMQVPFASHSWSRKHPPLTILCPTSCQLIMNGLRSTTPGQGHKRPGVHRQTHGMPLRRLGIAAELGRMHMVGPRHKVLASMVGKSSRKNTGGTLLSANRTNDQAQECCHPTWPTSYTILIIPCSQSASTRQILSLGFRPPRRTMTLTRHSIRLRWTT